jgi:hypothetical protein
MGVKELYSGYPCKGLRVITSVVSRLFWQPMYVCFAVRIWQGTIPVPEKVSTHSR